MNNKSAKLSNWRRGSIMMMSAGLAFFMVGMTALVTDLGYLYFNQARLQTAVNAGWKAGFDRMMQISPNQSPPATDVQEVIRGHIREVMKANGYTDAELTTVQIDFGPNHYLKVYSLQPVGLFFARVMNISSSNVAAMRQNPGGSIGIVPLGIPHGVIKDMSRSSYSGSLFGPGEGFATGSAYLLKLGSGGGKSTLTAASIKEKLLDLTGEESDPMDMKLILIPMDNVQTQPLKAYGAVFWCLRTDNADPGLYVPVIWMTGYRGGSFFAPYNIDTVNKLNEYSVYYEEINGTTAIDAILTAAGPYTEELFDRPRIGVYTSKTTTPAVATILAEAKIPYGTYSLLGGWARAAIYNSLSNNLLNDGSMLSGSLDYYHVLFTDSDEDLTGFSNGCSFFNKCCEDYIRELRLGKTNTDPTRSAAESYMCSYCQNFYDANYKFDFGYDKDMAKYLATEKDRVWSQINPLNGTYISRYNEVRANCLFKNRRCVDRFNNSGSFYYNLVSPNLAAPLMCGTASSKCGSYKGLRDFATAKGFTADAGSEPKPQLATPPLDANDAIGWFDKANPVQKMKWSIAERIRSHVSAGGQLFAQDFTVEALELALWQSSINQNSSPINAYDHCLGFTDYTYNLFPANANSYSSINKLVNSANQPFALTENLDLRSQNFGVDPDTASGVTNAFNNANLKLLNTTTLGSLNSSSEHVKYLKGKLNLGEYAFMGGANYLNTQSKRLVLNNVLYASLVSSYKAVAGGNLIPLAGRQKSNYGPIDPDNTTGGGASDYQDRFMFGFNGPIDVNDRIVSETGNVVGPTDAAADFRLNGDETYPPSTRIIVPITDIPPEVLATQPGASTIYDLQGKDQPNGAYTLDEYAFTSSIRVIGFAEFEIISEDDPRARVGEEYLPGDAGDLGPAQPGQVRAIFVRYIVKPGDIPLI